MIERNDLFIMNGHRLYRLNQMNYLLLTDQDILVHHAKRVSQVVRKIRARTQEFVSLEPMVIHANVNLNLQEHTVKQVCPFLFIVIYI